MIDKLEIPDELIDRLLAEYQGPEQLTATHGLIRQLRKVLIERVAGPELESIGYPPGRMPAESKEPRKCIGETVA